MDVIKLYTELKNNFVKVDKISFLCSEGDITTVLHISNKAETLKEITKDFEVNIITTELKNDVWFEGDVDYPSVTTIICLDERIIYNGVGIIHDDEFFYRPDLDLYPRSLDTINLKKSYISIADLYALLDEGAAVTSDEGENNDDK